MATIGKTLPEGFTAGHSRVEVFLSARELRNLDLNSLTDAFAVVSILYPDGKKDIIGRTEVIYDSRNPDFTTQIVVDYFFEELQTIEVSLYDEDQKGNPNLTAHDYIGEVTFTLGSLMGARCQTICLEIKKGKSSRNGKLIIRGEESILCTEMLNLSIQAEHLSNKDGLFGKSDPFFKILRSREDGSWMPVFTSNVIKNNLNPLWNTQRMNVGTVCNGDYDRPLKIAIWDYDSDGKHESMGAADISLRQIFECVGTARTFAVIEEEKKKKKSYTNSGVIKVARAEVYRQPSFLDFVKGGCILNLVVAIDFTGSNGHPAQANSLHYLDPTGQRLNHYQKAILSIGAIVRDYDTDKRFPVYGFGAKIGQHVSHCFPLHGQEGSVYDVSGIMAAYQNAITHVELSGPTLFSPIISEATRLAYGKCSQQSQSYTILLIITDGVINDMNQTIDAIVTASRIPMSIIIIGVGNADFSAMNDLDSDRGTLISSNGEKAARDIVQFVPFDQYSTLHFSKLAKDTLIEIPGQLLGFMEQNGITPNPPIAMSSDLYTELPVANNFYQDFNSIGQQQQDSSSLPPAYERSIGK